MMKKYKESKKKEQNHQKVMKTSSNRFLFKQEEQQKTKKEEKEENYNQLDKERGNTNNNTSQTQTKTLAKHQTSSKELNEFERAYEELKNFHPKTEIKRVINTHIIKQVKSYFEKSKNEYPANNPEEENLDEENRFEFAAPENKNLKKTEKTRDLKFIKKLNKENIRTDSSRLGYSTERDLPLNKQEDPSKLEPFDKFSQVPREIQIPCSQTSSPNDFNHDLERLQKLSKIENFREKNQTNSSGSHFQGRINVLKKNSSFGVGTPKRIRISKVHPTRNSSSSNFQNFGKRHQQ